MQTDTGRSSSAILTRRAECRTCSTLYMWNVRPVLDAVLQLLTSFCCYSAVDYVAMRQPTPCLEATQPDVRLHDSRALDRSASSVYNDGSQRSESRLLRSVTLCPYDGINHSLVKQLSFLLFSASSSYYDTDVFIVDGLGWCRVSGVRSHYALTNTQR